MQFQKANKKIISLLNNTYIYFILCMITSMPTIITTLYTYPVQDDFYNTWVVLQEVDKGLPLFLAALKKAVVGWWNYSGYYFSLFSTYFTDGLLNCNIRAIQIEQFIMALLYFFSLFCFLNCVFKEILLLNQMQSGILTFCLFFCLNGFCYYLDNENFFWLCATSVYLVPLICLWIGLFHYIYAIKLKKKHSYVISIIAAFLVGGAVLNVAALGCILYLAVCLWGMLYENKIKESMIPASVMVGFGLLNVIAPGNFVRKGSPITKSGVVDALKMSVTFGYSRYKEFFRLFPILWGIIAIILLCSICAKNKGRVTRLWQVICISIGAYAAICIVIFPVALGYGADLYPIMLRSIFVSDICMFFALFLLSVTFGQMIRLYINNNILRVSLMLAMGLLVLYTFKNTSINQLACYRIADDLKDGRTKEYSEWNISIINEIKEDENAVVKIYKDVMDDVTCLVNPKFYLGEYDYQKEFGNRSLIIMYKNKKALFFLPPL